MEIDLGKERLFHAERERVLTAWNNVAESGAVTLLQELYESQYDDPGGAEFRTFIDTAYPAVVRQYFDAHPEAAPLFVRQAQFQRRPERTAAICAVSFNHRDVVNMATRRKIELFEGVAAEADVAGAVTVFQFQRREDGMHVPMDITYRSEDKEKLRQRVQEEVERCYRMATYRPQPRNSR